MAKQSKRLLALFMASVMCFSLCLPSFAENAVEEKFFFDFETNDPDTYFANISGWNVSGTKAQFTIEDWEGEDSEKWGKVLKYENGSGNEQARIELGGAYDAIGFDFSFCFGELTNNVCLCFRQASGDFYGLILGKDNKVKLYETTVVAEYETDVWYDISIVLSKSKRYARLKIKPSASDEWKVIDGFTDKTDGTDTTGLFFDIFGGGSEADGEVKYFDNMRIYVPGDDFKPSLSTYSDDFEDGINHASSVTDYTTHWKSMNTNSQTEITAEPLDGYEGNVLKLKDVSSSASQVNLTIGKYPFTDASAPDVRHIMTWKMGANFDGGNACVYMKYVSPARNLKEEVNLLTLKENEIIMKDKNGTYNFDAVIEPDKLYDVTYSYDASAKAAILSVVDGNGDVISKFLDMGFFDSKYGYIYNIEFINASVGENVVYVDDFSWDINTTEFDIADAYVKSGDADGADIDETVIFEYTDIVAENVSPVVKITKDGTEIDTAYTASGKGNTVQVEFEELEKNSLYSVTLSGIDSAFGNTASVYTVEFTTSDYTVDVEEISVAGDTITLNLKGTYERGVEAYIAASAYDDADNLTEVKLLPIDVPYREAEEITFTPDFDGEYSYMKAVVIRNFANAISYSANVPANAESDDEDADEEIEAITKIEEGEDTFTVYGENVSEKDSVIAIQVLKSGKTWTDLAGFDYESGDITEILAGFDSVADVEYGEGYAFTQKLSESGIPAFRVRFGEGEIVYYDPVLMENINSAETSGELSEIVKADSAVWDEMSAVVENLEDDEEAVFWQILLETKDNLANDGTPLSLPAQVTEIAHGVSVLARLTLAAKDEFSSLFETFADEGAFETNSYDIYADKGSFKGFGMSDSQKLSFESHIQKNINKYVYFEDFIKDFDENAVFYAIKGGSKGAINRVLTESDLVDEEQFPTYFELSQTKKETVCSNIGGGKIFASVSAIEEAVENEAKKAKKSVKEPVSSGNGGGGGGGSSADIKGQPFVSVGEEDKAEVKELSFDDIAGVDWAQKAINALAEKKIVSGDGKGSFRPNDFVTREEFVKMLVLTLEISASSAEENFDDISASDWCQPYVAAAIAKGIVNGIDDSTFGKGRVITREEMATMTYRAVSAMGIMLGGADKEDFADTDSISDWAKESCIKMQEAGIINGMGSNIFAPKENVTRAQAAKILFEVLSR